jgi:hypothetical protein
VLSFVFLFMSMIMLKMFPSMFFSMCMTSRLWRRRLVFQKRNLLENTSLYLVVGQTKTRKLLLTGLETNTMSTYSDTMSYNSSLERHRSATSFSTLLKINPFCSFYTCDPLARKVGDSKKRCFTPICYHECLVVFHAV